MISPATLERPPAPPAPPAPAPPVRGRRYDSLVLLGLALVTEVTYIAGFVLPYPLAGNYTRPLLDLNRLNGHTPASANFFAIAWAISFAALFIAYRRCPARPTRPYFLVLGAAALVFNCTLLLMYPTGAADLFDQIFRARELAVYGKNPFVYTPDNALFAHDPFRAYVGGWANTTSPYGPVWETLAAGTATLAGNDLWRALILFKGLVMLAYAGTAGLIYATVRRVQPAAAARGLLFFAWNPLVLWETAGNGHNDMVMVLFTLLAFYLLARGGRVALLAPIALALGALTKFVPALLLAPLLAALWQMRRPAARGPGPRAGSWMGAANGALIGLAGFLVTLVVAYAPFWAGPQTVGALARRDLFTASIPNSLKDALAGTLLVSEAAAMDLVRTAATLVVGLAVVGATLVVLLRTRPGDHSGIVQVTCGAAYGVLFTYLVLGTLWFQPWYQTWLVAVTPLTARLATAKRTLVMNAGGVANYFVWDFLVLWNNSWGNVVQWSAALAVNLPVLLYTAYQWLVPEPAVAGDAEPRVPAPLQKEVIVYDRA